MVKVIVFLRDPLPRMLKISSDSHDIRSEVDLEDNPTIVELFDELAKKHGSVLRDMLLSRIKSGIWPLSVIVNYTAASPTTILQDGDTVNIHVASISGG